MRSFFVRLKDRMRGSQEDYGVPEEDDGEGYVELSADVSSEASATKVRVQSFVLEDFADVRLILDSLREGYTIALVNIKPLKNQDLVELKRAINKLKKTTEALDGDIAGFGEDWICVTPGFARIHRESRAPPQEQQRVQNYEPY